MFNFCNTPYRKRQQFYKHLGLRVDGYMYGVIELEQVA